MAISSLRRKKLRPPPSASFKRGSKAKDKKINKKG